MQGVGEGGHRRTNERRVAREGYVTRIPESTQSSLRLRLVRRQRERWPQLADVRVRVRTHFAYVDGVLPDGEVLPLCRLRYGGSASLWGFAIYLGSGNRYESSVLPSGMPIGEPQEALDCACGLYLNDPSAWLRTSAEDH
jgi:hypothetical protein